LQISDIAGISKEGDHTVINTFDQQQYVSSVTLEELMAILPPSTFFRANRQWIINRVICGAFTTGRSGKVELALEDPVNRSISVSQKRAQEFKAWLDEGTK
jgi:DNA-binding LytR/AlgR family response regulator